MKFDRFPPIADPVSLPVQIKPRHRLQVVPLADDLVAAFFDAPDQEAVATSQLAAWSGDEALCLPLLGSRLIRREGGLRYVFFLARSSQDLCRKGLWIAYEDRPVAEIDPTALQSPVVDAVALVVGLAPEGERRLLRALLTTGQSLFGDHAFLGIRDLVLQLLERLTPPQLALRAWCPLGQTAAIASYTLPKGLAVANIGNLVCLEPGAAHMMAGVEADFETVKNDRLLHLYLPHGMSPATTLVALSDTPLRLAGPSPTQRQRPLGPWLAQRSPQLRRRTRHRLNALAAQDETAASLVSEVSCPDTALPEVTPHLLSCTNSGIYYIVGVRDPRRLLGKLVLRTGDGDILLPLASPLHHPRLGLVQVGFVAAPQDCAPGDAAELFALYRSGRMTRIGTFALEPLPKSMPKLLQDLPESDVAPSLAAALADALRDRPKVHGDVIPVAAAACAPRVTLLVELGASLDYPYALAAALAGRRDVVVMLHHPDRRALAALRALGEELHAIYGIGVELFDIAQEDLLPAERLRAAVASAGTDAVICLSADVLPQQMSWLDPWLTWLARPEPVLAGAAVFGHDAGPEDCVTRPEGDDANPGANVDESVSARSFGLNAAARATLSGMPLRVAGRQADIVDLAATLRKQTGAHVALDPGVRMTSHAHAPERPRALDLAERLTLEGKMSA